MARLAGDEIYQILTFNCGDENADSFIDSYSLVSNQWREECKKFPLRIRKRAVSKVFDQLRIIDLELSNEKSDVHKLSTLSLKYLTELTIGTVELPKLMKCQFWKNLKKLKINDWLSLQQVNLLCDCFDLVNLEYLELKISQKYVNKGSFELFNNSQFNLRTLILNSCGLSELKITRKLEKLERLILPLNDITKIEIQDCLPNLTELDISGNFNLKDTSFLKSMPNLTKLDLKYNDNIEFGDHLYSLHNLKYLDLSFCCYRDKNLILGELQLRNIEFLQLSCNAVKLTKFFNNGKSCLSNISHLCVNIHKYYFEDDDCKLIGSGNVLRNLTYLSLCSSLKISRLEDIVLGPNVSNLKTLLLHASNIKIEGIKQIATSTTLTKLTELDISSNSIKDEGCEIICQAPNLKHLIKLEIYGNELTDRCNFEYIMKHFPKMKQLKMKSDSRI